MTLFPLLLFLAAVLPPSLLQDDYEVWNENLENLSTTRQSVQEEIVNKHNQLRRMVSPPGSDLLKMQWSNDARVNAQRWASQCTYEHSPPEARTTKIRCGENIFMSSYPASWSHAIQSWYDEVNDFSFGSGPNTTDAVVGHYTQVVWNTSFQVACGVAECPDQSLKFFYVCQYCPPGNFVERQYIPYTVGEPCALCPDHCEDGLCTNSCEYEDKYSNCADLKASVTCDYPLVKQNCNATCKCEGKIH
ncbi:cysteine-rich secretory protein 1-like isoform X1 [Peromyscus californicus insignis]|uniref:cysteine-rich secretory protein 1-like isoform X1 n=1 Tax=Peromyscus californicus insignis TaxID=564181 RepID=UPI0022A72F75|nr:cysteine-rich secretory protein 1-like isoform X1 [Peromyscus californicus insignis]